MIDILALITNFGYLGIFGLMTGESAFIPFPSEITMSFAGYLAGRGILSFWLVVAVGTVANLTGSLISYGLGRWKGAKWVRFALKKWGHKVLLHEEDFEKATQWFKKYGPGIVLVARCLPVVRAFISLPAGIAKMPVFSFVTFSLIGSFIWVTLLSFVGLKFGENWNVLEPYFKKAEVVIIVAIVGGILFVFMKLRKRK